MAFQIDPSIPLQANKVQFDPAAILMQAQQNGAALEKHRFEMQKLREDYDLAKEKRAQEKKMQMGIASDLAGIQSGTPAQYAPTRFEQTPQRGQMPQGMTGVMMREQGQQMPQPQAFGEEILNGDFRLGGGEVTQEAVAGREPSYLEQLQIAAKRALQVGDVDSAFKYSQAMQQQRVAEREQNAPVGNPYPIYDTQGNFVGTRVMTKAGQEIPFGTQGTTTVKPDVLTAKDKANQLFEKQKFDIQNSQKERELNQGQQKIDIERTKVGTESSDNAIDPNAPWAKVANPKEREKLKATVAIKDNARLDELRDAVTRSRANLRDMQRFGELNRRTGTGGLNDKYNPMTFNADKQEMEAIEARLTPQMRPAGSGATSDFEGKMYGRGIPQTTKSGKANREIRLTAEKALKLGEAELAFKEQFLQKNGYLPKDSQTNQFLREFESQGKTTINHGDTLSELPPTAPKGAVAKNAQTGKPEYIFNGTKWIPVGGSK
jgi:hypothetical protein